VIGSRAGVRLAIVVVACVLALLVGEVGGRIALATGGFPPETRSLFQHVAWPIVADPVYYREDTEHGVAVLPGLDGVRYFFPGGSYTVSTIGLGEPVMGFRTHAPRGRPFGVVVGDSHAFCATVEEPDCWVTLAEKQTAKEVVNLSIPGTGSLSHALVIRRYARPLRPEVVVWQFTTNDPLDDVTLRRRQGRQGVVARVKGWLAYHSFVYNLIQLVVPSGHRNLAHDVKTYTAGATRVEFSRRHFSSADRWDPEFVEGWRLTTEAIREGRREAEAVGARFVVLLIPYKEEVYRDVVARLFPDTSLLAPADEVSARLRAFLEREGIGYVDATPALKAAAARGEAIYQVSDVHLTSRGNAIVAGVIAEALGR
jgi:hypothetical protein